MEREKTVRIFDIFKTEKRDNKDTTQVQSLLFLLLLLQHYNLGWVLAFSKRLFHSFLFPINSFQFFTLSTCKSLRIPSIHLFLGLSAGLFPNGF
jgi:hypothetical protein